MKSTIEIHVPPRCEMGYPEDQLRELLHTHEYDRLMQFMYGQTVGVCEGRKYNHETKEYEVACNGVSHGVVVYSHDLERFIAGLPVVD